LLRLALVRLSVVVGVFFCFFCFLFFVIFYDDVAHPLFFLIVDLYDIVSLHIVILKMRFTVVRKARMMLETVLAVRIRRRRLCMCGSEI
jgi:hypothetical protein